MDDYFWVTFFSCVIHSSVLWLLLILPLQSRNHKRRRSSFVKTIADHSAILEFERDSFIFLMIVLPVPSVILRDLIDFSSPFIIFNTAFTLVQCHRKNHRQSMRHRRMNNEEHSLLQSDFESLKKSLIVWLFLHLLHHRCSWEKVLRNIWEKKTSISLNVTSETSNCNTKKRCYAGRNGSTLVFVTSYVLMMQRSTGIVTQRIPSVTRTLSRRSMKKGCQKSFICYLVASQRVIPVSRNFSLSREESCFHWQREGEREWHMSWGKRANREAGKLCY